MDRIIDPLKRPAAPRLPPLRRDLSLLPAPISEDGRARYLIHDPVNGRFHRISAGVAEILSLWDERPIAAFAEHLVETGLQSSRASAANWLKTLIQFLDRNRLLDASTDQQSTHLAGLEARRRRPWHEILLHKYLFIRIPLFRPQGWLDRIMPWLEPWIRPGTGWIIGLIGLAGIYLAARQWSDFVSTFLYFFTPGGLVFYGLTLLIIKSLHELGHAVTARRAGAAVPIIGVAVLVMFPILYTDTTDAWRLRDRKQRVLIDAGGIIAELIIACLAIFAWAVLPDGALRSAAFFTATTSWTMSLLVNLNPTMRFDGYYLLSDALGIENMQERGFALGRWQMRKTLLGLNAPKPAERRPVLLCAYAYATWVYRFFLFIGIALLVHHIFPKAIGIVLFCAEIGVFILRPAARELQHWWRHKMDILTNWRGRITGLILALGIISLFIPWQTRLIVPALIRPAQQTQVFGQNGAAISQVKVVKGQRVQEGDILIILQSPRLDHELDMAQRALTLAQLQFNKQAADRAERRDSALRQVQLIEAISRVETLQRERDMLTVRAPFSGTIANLHTSLEPELRTSERTALLSLRGQTTEFIALAREADQSRIQAGQAVRFISSTIDASPRSFQIASTAQTAQTRIDTPLLTSSQGGSIAVSEDVRGRLIPDQPVFIVTAQSIEPIDRTERGVAVISAKARAPITPIRRRILGILLRETDF